MAKKTLEDLEDTLLAAAMMGLIEDVIFNPCTILIKFHNTMNVKKTIVKLIDHLQVEFEETLKHFHTSVDDDSATLEIFHFRPKKQFNIDEEL